MTAVRWHIGDAAEEGRALWPELERAGWFGHHRRIVIHVPQAGRTPLATATARSLIRFLTASGGPTRVDVIDSPEDAAAWQPATVVDPRVHSGLRVESPGVPDGTPIPELWLEEFCPVTIAPARPDRAYGLAGVLVGQAELVVEEQAFDLDRIAEAYRLLAPAVSVVCGAVDYDGPGASWWAASTDAATLDRAVARAAGYRPEDVPYLAYLERHTRVNDGPAADATAPRLRGYQSSSLAVRAERARRRLAHVRRTVIDDTRRGAINLRRIPDFIRRRLPAAGGSA